MEGIEIMSWPMRPAKVMYIGKACYLFTNFTKGKIYDAYFLDFWHGSRCILHVKGDDGSIDRNCELTDFFIISDSDNVLNTFEATVKFDDDGSAKKFPDLTIGHSYRALGCDKDGYFLVIDDSCESYFYKSSHFRIICDPHDLLCKPTIYFSKFASPGDLGVSCNMTGHGKPVGEIVQKIIK